MEIHWFDLPTIDDEAREKAAHKIEQLAERHSDLIDVRIANHGSGHGRHPERGVRITCQARGAELVATGSGETEREALDRALDRWVHEVRKLRDKRRTRRLARDA